MGDLIGFLGELFAGAAPRRGEYGKTFVATILAALLIFAFVAATLLTLHA